jgi:hypothetical protein
MNIVKARCWRVKTQHGNYTIQPYIKPCTQEKDYWDRYNDGQFDVLYNANFLDLHTNNAEIVAGGGFVAFDW